MPTGRRAGSEESTLTRYARIIERVFFNRYKKGAAEVPFEREDIPTAAAEIGLERPRNVGDVVYSFRNRQDLPESIRKLAPAGMEWQIRSEGTARYKFVAVSPLAVEPNPSLAETKIPDATPGIITMHALTDEQALLARLRYNRLVDVFTGVAAYSLQSHLKTTVPDMGGVEADEVYVGVDRRGAQYVFPIEAKGQRDRLRRGQIESNIALCADKFPRLICRPLGAQSMANDLIALFEFEESKSGLAITSEKHYRLVPSEELTPEDLETYRRRSD